MKEIYQGDNNWVFDTGENIENELLVGSINSAPNDAYWRFPKEDYSKLPHDGNTPHPTNPLMIKNAGCHILTSGDGFVTYSWTEKDNLDLDYVRNFLHYLETIFPEEQHVIEHSISPNGYLKLYQSEAGSVTEFSPLRPEYILKSDRLIEINKGFSLLCVLKMDPNSDEWSTTYRDAQAGDTITLEPVGTKTYFIFGSVVQKDGQNLEKHKTYKVTREIEVTCPEFTKIVRVHQK